MDNSLYTAKTLVRERAEMLPPEVTSLITNGALDVTIYGVQTEFHLTNKQSKLLENEIILVLLFFLDRKGFAERIAESLEIDSLLAASIESFIQDDFFYELQDIFTLVQNPNKNISNKIKQEGLSELQQTFTQNIAGEQNVASTPPTQPEAMEIEDIQSSATQEPSTPVQTMRTMEGDISRVHGYGAYRAEFPEEPQETEHAEEVIRSASQEDLLQEKPKLAGMPTYEEKE